MGGQLDNGKAWKESEIRNGVTKRQKRGVLAEIVKSTEWILRE